MQTVKLKGIEGDFHVQAENGVFLTLLAMQWQSVTISLFFIFKVSFCWRYGVFRPVVRGYHTL